MDTAIGEQAKPRAALPSRKVRKALAVQKVMTAVWCRACDAHYSAPVEPWIINAIRRCGNCGHRALEVVH